MKKRYMMGVFLFLCVGLKLFPKPDSPLQKEKTTLHLVLRTEPLTLDPRKNSDGITSLFFLFISEGLTRISPSNHEPECSLAESVEISEDGKIYQFKIRDCTWSDGHPITSYDFERSWKEALNPDFGGYNPEYLFCIENAKEVFSKEKDPSELGIETPDSKTLIVCLHSPMPCFLELVSNKIFFPVPAHNHKKVFSGPFVIKHWKHSDKIVLKKNPYYWDRDAVKLDKIELNLIEDETTQLLLFEQDKLDWVGAPLSLLPIDGMKSLKNSEFFHTFSIASLYYYSFNTARFPLHHVKIRKALAYAIGRDELINHVTQGDEKPARCLIPSLMNGFHTNFFPDGDQTLAKELFQQALEELNLTQETFPVLTLSCPAAQSSHIIAQAIQQQWQRAFGIKVSIENKEWQVFLSDIHACNYDIGALGRGTHHLDPFFYLALFKNKDQASNRTGWENKEYQRLLDKAQQLTGDERYELLSRAEAIFVEEMPIAPILFPTHAYLKKTNLKNVCISSVGSVDFKWAYLE